MKLEERLNEIISEKEDKIEELEKEIADLTEQQDLSRLKWQMASVFKHEGFYKELPYPRLEMRLNRLSKNDWYSIEWLYGLVYKHITDVDNDTLIFSPLGHTTSSGGKATFENWMTDGKLQLPFRDGLHIYAESLIFKIPAFIVCREKEVWSRIEDQGWGLGNVPAMSYSPPQT